MNNRRGKNLLLIKTDNIGDYVLFRNCIEVLKKSERYKDYKITLVGNPSFKGLAESLDSGYVDEFVWINNLHYAYNPLYRSFVNNKLNRKNFDVVINPMFSRVYKVTETLVKSINAREKVGSSGDLTNITAAHRAISNGFYTKLFSAKDGVLFEFLRNREFFEALLGEESSLKKPCIDIGSFKSRVKLPENYVVLAPGASKKTKEWDTGNFASIADFLSAKYGLTIVICGSKKDKTLARKVNKAIKPANPIDLTGKTSLMELTCIIKNAELVISGDTSFYHIAAAVDTKVVCLSNGVYFGRFVPYPKEVYAGVRTLFPPEIEENFGDTEGLTKKYLYASTLDINQIRINEVKEAIKEFMADF